MRNTHDLVGRTKGKRQCIRLRYKLNDTEMDLEVE